jgi:hypothetical protein
MGDLKGKSPSTVWVLSMLTPTCREQLWKKISWTSERTGAGTIRGHLMRPSLGLKTLLSFQMKSLPLREMMEGLTRCGPKLTRTITLSSMENGVCVISHPFIERPLMILAVQVHQIPFAWDLAMSTKLDAHSNVIGCYETEDLATLMWPEEKKKHRRRVKRRYLEHELVWNITEMQVKTFVRAIFPNPTGPLTMQLAKERPLGPHELTYGESRSEALIRDIQVSAGEVVHVTPATSAALPRQLMAKKRNNGQTVEQDEGLDDILGSSGRQLVNDLANEYQQPRAEVAQMTDHVQTVRHTAQMTSGSHITQEARMTETLGIPGPSRPDSQDGPSHLDESTDVSFLTIIISCIAKLTRQLIPRNDLQLTSASTSNLKMDGRRRDG